MAGKRIRSRTSQNLISVASLSNRPLTVAATNGNSQGRTGGPPNNATSKNIEELMGMTKEQLKNECRKRGQKTTGNKAELLQRLGLKMTSHAKRKDASSSTTSSNGAPPSDDFNIPKSHQKNSDKQRKDRERKERENLVLWKQPITTVEYATKELIELLRTWAKKILENGPLVVSILISAVICFVLIKIPGAHQAFLTGTYKKFLWCGYWIGLGILSSVGLGTGLHTFLLYLGPHIAAVTLAAYECDSLDFPEPPYPDTIICADEPKSKVAVTIFSIMSKVRLEAMCWGAGTALGELPPYFMARAARLSGIDPDDEDDDLKEFEELQKKQKNKADLTLIERGKLFVEELVQKVGFLGILACASIPNPLFDLAGITCGHFLVPFWTFFGATLIGKAIIKMHIQKLFVIIAFNENLIVKVLDLLKHIPVIGKMLQEPVKSFLDDQKLKLHKNSAGKTSGGGSGGGGSFLGAIFEKFVVAMILYFVLSIVNSFAQSYHKRIHKKTKMSAVPKISKD